MKRQMNGEARAHRGRVCLTAEGRAKGKRRYGLLKKTKSNAGKQKEERSLERRSQGGDDMFFIQKEKQRDRLGKRRDGKVSEESEFRRRERRKMAKSR